MHLFPRNNLLSLLNNNQLSPLCLSSTLFEETKKKKVKIFVLNKTSATQSAVDNPFAQPIRNEAPVLLTARNTVLFYVDHLSCSSVVAPRPCQMDVALDPWSRSKKRVFDRLYRGSWGLKRLGDRSLVDWRRGDGSTDNPGLLLEEGPL